MNNYLAVDTSGSHLTVVACKDGQAYPVFIKNCAMKQSTLLMGAIDEALQKASLALQDCDFFAAVVGAGSFTGIRIGIAAMKGFCLAHGKPSLPVTSFDVAAYNAIENAGKALCLIDALHGCYYACGYENGEVVYPPAYLEEDEVLVLQKQGYTLCACEKLPLAEKTEVQVFEPVAGLLRAVNARAAKGGFGELTALYVRKSSAEINLEKGQKA